MPGDDLATIASGPTVADPTSFADARAIVDAYRLTLPASLARQLEKGEETPNRVIRASPATAKF